MLFHGPGFDASHKEARRSGGDDGGPDGCDDPTSQVLWYIPTSGLAEDVCDQVTSVVITESGLSYN